MTKITTTYCSETNNLVKPTATSHAVKTTIQHWQLRDLLSPGTDPKEVMLINQNDVIRYNVKTKMQTPFLASLNFAPTSQTSNSQYMALGGQRSQLLLRSLTSTWQAQTSLGGSINNALSLSIHLGETRLLVSNNDESIKVVAVPSLQRIASISLPTAVNYMADEILLASVSPDGRKMVVVGDSSEVYLFDISAGGYQRMATLTASQDAGFSASWNSSSDKFAVASQDGYVSVWDVRSTEKLASIASKQNPQVKGAVRCLKFSPQGPTDLLMFSEHVSYVNFVDARTFNSKQSIRVAPAQQDLHISGITFSSDAKSVYVGTENSLLEYSVDHMSRRSFQGGDLI